MLRKKSGVGVVRLCVLSFLAGLLMSGAAIGAESTSDVVVEVPRKRSYVRK